MPVPRASANRLPDISSLLTQAFSGMFAPQQPDGLRALSQMNNPSPNTLWGPALVSYWSSQDAHTPDKINQQRLDEMYRLYPGSAFSNWLGGIGAAPGQGGRVSRAAAYNSALGIGGGGGGGSQWWNPMGGLSHITGRLGRIF